MYSRGEPIERGELEELAEKVRQIAYDLHVYLGNGLLEKVYENALKHRLEKVGYTVETQKEMKVYDEDGFEIGDYFADVVVENELIVELKAVRAIAPEHLAQTMNYLKITGKKLGLIINFGSYKFETRMVYPPIGNNGHVEHEERIDVKAGVSPRPPREYPPAKAACKASR